MPPILRPSWPLTLPPPYIHDLLRRWKTKPVSDMITSLVRRQDTDAAFGIIPQNYPAGHSTGAVVGITLGSVAGFLLICILFFFIMGGRANGPGPAITGQEDIVVPKRRSRRARSHRSKSRDGYARTHRSSHRRSGQFSEREMREISTSPSGRRPSRTIVDERVERVRDSSHGQRPPPPRIVLEERIVDDRRSRRAPSMSRHDGDDIVEVIEEGSIDSPPRRSRRKSSGHYRDRY